ncbi:hypothetical protein RZ71_12790 [Apilactobacillus kunkeei]|uniref:Uncharacterized protein n=1 Tax=Apilactobacillus kunkeei TaxID=148814 RepID=A0A0M9DBV1_9LACO|nr:hypothetical protein RZ71_12790 [Apilactobacillus kunkeei]
MHIIQILSLPLSFIFFYFVINNSLSKAFDDYNDNLIEKSHIELWEYLSSKDKYERRIILEKYKKLSIIPFLSFSSIVSAGISYFVNFIIGLFNIRLYNINEYHGNKLLMPVDLGIMILFFITFLYFINYFVSIICSWND